jgi:hypothetical protein
VFFEGCNGLENKFFVEELTLTYGFVKLGCVFLVRFFKEYVIAGFLFFPHDSSLT